jgi:hypothetical protein
MNIACLGWGSFIWDPRKLPVRRTWFNDGPFVPLEFLRQQNDGRVTLVIDGNSRPMRVMWSVVDANVQEAKEALKERLGLVNANWQAFIGTWEVGMELPTNIPTLEDWASARGVDAVIWAALRPRFKKESRRASADEIVAYLRELTGDARSAAERYIRSAAPQIDTVYRRTFEKELGWTPL